MLVHSVFASVLRKKRDVLIGSPTQSIIKFMMKKLEGFDSLWKCSSSLNEARNEITIGPILIAI